MVAESELIGEIDHTAQLPCSSAQNGYDLAYRTKPTDSDLADRPNEYGDSKSKSKSTGRPSADKARVEYSKRLLNKLASLEQSSIVFGGEDDDRFYRHWHRFLKTTGLAQQVATSTDVKGQAQNDAVTGLVGGSQQRESDKSFEEAAAACRAIVRSIVRNCRRTNIKFDDERFDVTTWGPLFSLDEGASMDPQTLRAMAKAAGVKRIADLFETPKFFGEKWIDAKIAQGELGDCWFLAGVAALTGTPRMLERLCVDHDKAVGVYGFCFYRDGEWIVEVVDDQLYTKQNDLMRQYLLSVRSNRDVFDEEKMKNKKWGDMLDLLIGDLPDTIREELKKGSQALKYASCSESEETWLPLIEKAYAKANHSYGALNGGSPGDAIQALTGGVNTELSSDHILDKERLWQEMEQANKDFLFSCGSIIKSPYDAQSEGKNERENGIMRSHAYTILDTATVRHDGAMKRLVKLRNPWGRHEWKGAWGDGSKEWTPEIMKELKHTFGEDGVFWIAYEDLLKHFSLICRTRIFRRGLVHDAEVEDGERAADDQLPGPGIPPPKLRTRHFAGLEGRYEFTTSFRLYKDGQRAYVVRSRAQNLISPSTNVELELDEGNYTLRIKVEAHEVRPLDCFCAECRRRGQPTHKSMLQQAQRKDLEAKLLEAGMEFEKAHTAAGYRELEEKVWKALIAESKRLLLLQQRLRREMVMAGHVREKRRSLRIMKMEDSIRAQMEATERKMRKEKGPFTFAHVEAKPAVEVKGDKSAGAPSTSVLFPKLSGGKLAPEETKDGKSKDDKPAPQPANPLFPKLPNTSKNATPNKSGDNKLSSTPEDPPFPSPPAEPHAPHDLTTSPEPYPQISYHAPHGSSKALHARNDDPMQTLIDEAERNLSASGGHGGKRGGRAKTNHMRTHDLDFAWDDAIDGEVDVVPEDLEEESDGKRWLALCTLGVRVHSRDPHATLEILPESKTPFKDEKGWGLDEKPVWPPVEDGGNPFLWLAERMLGEGGRRARGREGA